jgi:hypothetical protein
MFILGLSMTSLSISQNDVASQLFSLYERFRDDSISTRVFTHRQLTSWIGEIATHGSFHTEVAGRSAEGRDILLLRVGSGPITVLLWSQMHGDEPTATMALVDMLNFFSLFPDHPVAKAITEHLTVAMLPMINPDGAERFQRRTAQLIDMNRDALTLRTHEARVLKGTRDRLDPAFGFNLHDQSPRYAVGATKKVAAIGLLATALDEAKSTPPSRLRAKHVAGDLADIFAMFIPGHIARYDDTFEPRAFGDNMQKWGTSTVLIESGGWPGDSEKMFLRKLNAVALLAVLYDIALGKYERAAVASYEDLPFNRELFYDLIIRGAHLQANSRTSPIITDIGFNYEGGRSMKQPADSSYARIVDVGNLDTYGSFEEVDGSGLSLDSTVVRLQKRILKSELMQIIGRK